MPRRVYVVAVHRVIMIILFATTCYSTYAQSRTGIGSLIAAYKAAASDQDKLALANAIALQTRFYDSATTLLYADDAIKTSLRIKNFKGIADALAHKGWALGIKGHFDESETFFMQSLDTSKKHGYPLGSVNALSGLGVLKRQKGDYNGALSYYDTALSMADKLNDETKRAELLGSIGTCLGHMGDYRRALENYFGSLQIYERNGMQAESAKTMLNMAAVYALIQEYGNAYRFNQQALAIYTKLQDTVHLGLIYLNLGQFFQSSKGYDSALFYFEKSLNIFEKFGNMEALAEISQSMAKVYAQQQKFQLAAALAEKSLQATIKMGKLEGQCENLLLMGIIEYNSGDRAQARKLFEECYNLAAQIRHAETWRSSAEWLSTVYAEERNYQSAYQYTVVSRAIGDTLRSTEDAKKITRLELQYAFQKERDSLQLQQLLRQVGFEQQLNRKEREQSVLVFGLVFTFMAAGFAGALYWQKKKANQKLLVLNREIAEMNDEITVQNEELRSGQDMIEQQNQQLSALKELQDVVIAQQHKDLRLAAEQLLDRNKQLIEFSQITSHNIRGPLARIMGLVALMQSANTSVAEKETMVAKLQECSDEMDRMIRQVNHILSFTVHDQYHDSLIPLHELATSISHELQLLYPDLLWQLETHKLEVPTITANRAILGSVLYFLFDNCIKFRSDRDLIILFSSKRRGNAIVLEIEDNGTGFDALANQSKLFQLHQRFHPDTHDKGIGLYLTKMQVTLMGGNIALWSEPGRGCRVTIELNEAQNQSDTIVVNDALQG